MNNLKSKNSVHLEQPQKYPNSDILTIPMHQMRIDINNNKNRLDSQQSSKNLDRLRQSHQSSTTNLRLDNPHNKSSENLIKKTPTRTKVCTSIDKIHHPLIQNNFSLSPHNAYIKPQFKQEDDQQKIISFSNQKSNLIIDNRKEQIFLQLQQAQQLLILKEQENQKLQEINIRLYEENKKLFNQGEDMLKDIETMRQNFDQQNNEYMMLKQQNQQLIEDVKLIQNERNQTQSHSDQILNHKNYEIQQLQNQLRQYQQLLENKDQTISNLKQQLNIIQQQDINQFSKNNEKSYNNNQQLENANKLEQQDLNQVTNQFLLYEKKQNIISSNQNGNIIYQKQYNKLKQMVQIQKKQIESQQKTIMNQHYEIQNLQNLLYSNEQDCPASKNCNIFNENFSNQQLNIYDIVQQPIDKLELQHISFKQQKQNSNVVIEDTFRIMQKEQELFNSNNDQ